METYHPPRRLLPADGLRVLRNPAADRERPYGPEERDVVSLPRHREACEEIVQWPGYHPTPLRELDGLARLAEVAHLHYKDEAYRFSLGSFKALGGAYGVLRAACRRVAERTGREPDPAEVRAGEHARHLRRWTVTCATAGNHGRAVAWGARLAGCRCVVYVPRETARARAKAIEALGAKVRRTAVGYDETVAVAMEAAGRRGWTLVADTSAGGAAPQVVADVMQGYTVLVAESLEQAGRFARGLPPTHVFVQAGVGGLAAAVCGHLWELLGAARPTLAVVEPDGADCLLQSARAGRPVTLAGPFASAMRGMAVGQPSPLAWRILHPGADVFLAVPDGPVEETMRLLSEGRSGAPPLAVGSSGAAGLAAFLCAVQSPEARQALRLSREARVLVVATEGAMDPEGYRRVVGREASAVEADGG